MYEVLGLFIFFLVGVMLVMEGGHLAHLSLFGDVVHQMNTTTFYFVIAFIVVIDIVQSRYQKKINVEEAKEEGNTEHSIGEVTCPWCETDLKENPEDLLKGVNTATSECNTCKRKYILSRVAENKYITKTFEK